MRELRSKQFWFSWLGVLLGAFIVAAGFVLFTNPYNIVPGGVYGLGCAFHKLVPSIATGTFGLMMDIPLMITGFLIFGAKFGAKTVFAALITPVIMNGMTALVGDSIAVSEGVGFIAQYLNFSNNLLIPSIFALIAVCAANSSAAQNARKPGTFHYLRVSNNSLLFIYTIETRNKKMSDFVVFSNKKPLSYTMTCGYICTPL